MNKFPNLLEFIENLSTSNPLKLTKADVMNIKLYIDSDGCTGVPDFYKEECIKHDFYYRTHHNFKGELISKNQADLLFMQGIQSKSQFGKFSPMALWRYIGVKLFGGKAWEGNESCH